MIYFIASFPLLSSEDSFFSPSHVLPVRTIYKWERGAGKHIYSDDEIIIRREDTGLLSLPHSLLSFSYHIFIVITRRETNSWREGKDDLRCIHTTFHNLIHNYHDSLPSSLSISSTVETFDDGVCRLVLITRKTTQIHWERRKRRRWRWLHASAISFSSLLSNTLWLSLGEERVTCETWTVGPFLLCLKHLEGKDEKEHFSKTTMKTWKDDDDVFINRFTSIITYQRFSFLPSLLRRCCSLMLRR